MTQFNRRLVLATIGFAATIVSTAALAEAKPVWTPPIKFDYKIVPVTGCVLRPTRDAATAEMSCTLNPITIAQCEETKGELGSIDGQLMCRSPRTANAVAMQPERGGPRHERAAMGPAGKPPVAAVSPYEPPYGPDAQAEARWKPKIITVKTRPVTATQAGGAGKEGQ